MNSVEHTHVMLSRQSEFIPQSEIRREPDKPLFLTLRTEGIKLLIFCIVVLFGLITTPLLLKHKLPNKKKSEWEGEPL